MKLITPGVFDLIKLYTEGNFPGGNFFGPVGLASYHDFDSQIPGEVKATIEEIDGMLQDGSLSTGYSP